MTGVQTCALPISVRDDHASGQFAFGHRTQFGGNRGPDQVDMNGGRGGAWRQCAHDAFQIAGAEQRVIDPIREHFAVRIRHGGEMNGPGDLERIVGALPPDATPPPIHIDVIGAAISRELRAAAERKLARSMVVTYGTNEVHHVSLVDRNQVGTLFPGVRIRIADDNGNERPPGETGFIHIQTATMTAGYMGSHDADRSALRDGWYRSRDIGYQPSQDRLVVLGRTDNVMNVGGVKIDPGPIEAAIKKIAGVSDALVTVLRDEIASGILLVAVETNPDRPPPGLRRAIIRLIGPRLGFHRVLMLAAFPRTELGKVRRSDIVAIAAVRFRVAGPHDPQSS